MFEFEPDEYLFTKFANYFKRRKKRKESSNVFAASLEDIKPRLTLFARAVTGKSIEIYVAEREGGYKNDNFFLPKQIDFFKSVEQNISFYLFRVLYLSIQKNKDLNWNDNQEHELLESQVKASETSTEILKDLFTQFPITEKYYTDFIAFFKEKATTKTPADYSFIFGKWMRNNPEEVSNKKLENFTDKVKKAQEEKIETVESIFIQKKAKYKNKSVGASESSRAN